MTEVISHRGVAINVPENSLAAFERAILDGADGIEFDVRLSSDGEPFVFHNYELDGLSHGSGPLAAHSSTELRKLLLKSSDNESHPIPTLQEVLDLVVGKISLEIELKALQPEIVGAVKARLTPYRSHWESMEITSFEPSLLRLMADECPIPVDILTPRSEPWMTSDYIAYQGIQRARLARARGVHLDASQVSASAVELIRSSGFSVHVHGVDTLESLTSVLDLEIERFDTDHLGDVLEWLRARDG